MPDLPLMNSVRSSKRLPKTPNPPSRSSEKELRRQPVISEKEKTLPEKNHTMMKILLKYRKLKNRSLPKSQQQKK